MKAEIVEVDMSPVAGVPIDQANEDLLALMRPEVHDDAAQVFLLDPGRLRKHLPGVLADELDAGFRPGSAADEKRRPGVRDLELHRGQGTLGAVPLAFVGADPVIPLVLAFHIAPTGGDCVALNWLAGECFALGFPVFKGTGLEVEVERLTVGAGGQNAFGGRRFFFRWLGGEDREKKTAAQKQHQGVIAVHGRSRKAGFVMGRWCHCRRWESVVNGVVATTCEGSYHSTDRAWKSFTVAP